MGSPQGTNRTIFVTVGTTLFEALIDGVTSASALQWMAMNGYERLVIQYGKGRKPKLPDPPVVGLSIECYDYKPSLEADMQSADLIISHAGAGTVMECVRLRKRLVVVINTLLMDNHQTELADAMGRREHLYVVHDPVELAHAKRWDDFESFRPVHKEPGDEGDFPRVLLHFLGLDKDT
jgi:beta-1,4-N-acetylglucosaminyltransferase